MSERCDRQRSVTRRSSSLEDLRALGPLARSRLPTTGQQHRRECWPSVTSRGYLGRDRSNTTCSRNKARLRPGPIPVVHRLAVIEILDRDFATRIALAPASQPDPARNETTPPHAQGASCRRARDPAYLSGWPSTWVSRFRQRSAEDSGPLRVPRTHVDILEPSRWAPISPSTGRPAASWRGRRRARGRERCRPAQLRLRKLLDSEIGCGSRPRRSELVGVLSCHRGQGRPAQVLSGRSQAGGDQ